MTIGEIIGEIIKVEAGYVNNPADRGGPTKYGITAATLGEWRRLFRPATESEVQGLTEEEAHQIYHHEYLIKPGFDKFDWRLQMVMFDAQVQHPGGMSVKFLQRAMGIKDDGILGPLTLSTTATWDPWVLCMHCIAERLEFYGRITTKNLTDADKDGIPDNTEMNWGWMNRMSGLIKTVTPGR